jgi:hypothetical protein
MVHGVREGKRGNALMAPMTGSVEIYMRASLLSGVRLQLKGNGFSQTYIVTIAFSQWSNDAGE